jgi:hypothetical protein
MKRAWYWLFLLLILHPLIDFLLYFKNGLFTIVCLLVSHQIFYCADKHRDLISFFRIIWNVFYKVFHTLYLNHPSSSSKSSAALSRIAY